MQELLDGFEKHGAAPDDCRGGVDEVAYGHGFDTVVGEGDELVVLGEKGLFLKVEEGRDGGAEDVGVEDAGAEA